MASAQIIEQIVIRNNQKTKDWVIHRELLFKAGDTLSFNNQQILQRCHENIFNTTLFNNVTIKDTSINQMRTILIDVEERWYFWPYFIFEPADRNLATYLRSEKWERINYGVMATKHNFRGRNEDLSLKIRLGFRQQLGIHYFIPHISKRIDKIGLLFDISMFRQKSTFVNIIDFKYHFLEFNTYAFLENRFRMGALFRPQHNIKHHIISSLHLYNSKETTPETNQTLLGTKEPISNWLIFDYIFEYNTLDYVLYPTKGILLTFAVSSATDFKSNNWQNANLNLNINQPFLTHFTYSTSLFGEHFFNAPPPIGLRRTIGNNYYFRGYEDNVWNAQTVGGLRQQVSWNFFRKRHFKVAQIPAKKFNKPFLSFYATGFTDMGYITNISQISGNKFLISFGTGIDMISYYDLIFRFETVLNNNRTTLFNVHIGKVF